MQQPEVSRESEYSTVCTQLLLNELNHNLQRLSLSNNQSQIDLKINPTLTDFISRMQNMFDNYVCFGGERHTAKLQRNYTSAFQYANSSFQHAAKTNADNARLCNDICTNIFEIFCEENREIEKQETKLFDEMSTKIVSSYLKKISTYLSSLLVTNPKENNLSSLAEVHKILVHQLIKVALNSFNFGDKGNFVLDLFTEKLEKSINRLFEEILAISCNISNQETLQAELSIRAYVHCMQDFENPTNWQNYQHVRELHSKTLSRVTKNLSNDIREDVKRRLYTYFLYIYQHYTERIDSSKDSRALCIQLAPEFIQVGFHTISGNKFECEQMCPRLFIRKNNSKTNHLADHHILYHIEHCMVFEDISRKLLVEFFRLNYEEQCKNMVQEIKQLIVIIPSWLSVEQRHFLCSCARFGGFKQIYLANESSMAAYHWLTAQKCISPEINCSFVVVSLNKVGVQVEIYSLNEQGKLLLLALSCNFWEDSELDCTTFFGGSYTSLCKRDTSPEYFTRMINDTFEKAFDQVSNPYNLFVKACVLKTETKAWNEHVNFLFSEREHLVKVSESFYELAFHSALKFSHSASKLRKQILDHATHIPPLTIEKTNVQTPICLNNGGIACSCNSYGNNDQQLIHERKEKLLNKCLTLEHLLQQGDLNVVAKRKLIKMLTDIQSTEFLDNCDKRDLDEKEKMLDKLTAKFVSK